MRKKLEEAMHVHVRLLSQDSTFDLFNSFPKFIFQNLSCQTRGAAYLRVRLIRRCLQYMQTFQQAGWLRVCQLIPNSTEN